jgi:predicted Rdx family selenoprotein
MDNTQNQSIAVDAIHRISQEANMLVFMLVDEDLEVFSDDVGDKPLTQDEKDAIWERMHEAFLDHYHEMLDQVVRDVIDERDA